MISTEERVSDTTTDINGILISSEESESEPGLLQNVITVVTGVLI